MCVSFGMVQACKVGMLKRIPLYARDLFLRGEHYKPDLHAFFDKIPSVDVNDGTI